MDDVGPLSEYNARMVKEGVGEKERKERLVEMMERREEDRERVFREGMGKGKGKGEEEGKK